MCTQPIKILNPKLKAALSTFNKDIDQIYIKVPCGHCTECCNQKRNDWIVRLSNEYEFTKEQNGFVLMETFTYSNAHIPYLFGQYAFSKEHYKTFCKKLRVYLDRHFISNVPNIMAQLYTPSLCSEPKQHNKETKETLREMTELYPEYSPANNIKIFWTSEYGGELGRPHYHANIFCTMKGITPYELREYIRKAWIYGFTDKRPIEAMTIQGYEGIYYVAKYVTKTTNEFLQRFCYSKSTTDEISRKYYSKYGEVLDKEAFRNAPIYYINKVMKDIDADGCMPFTRCSKGLGLEGLKKITNEEWEAGTIKIHNRKSVIQLVRIPEYYKRKYMYDYDKISNTFSLNDRGIIIKTKWKENIIHKTIQDVDITMNQYSRHYAAKLKELNTDYNYFNNVWTKYKNRNGIMRFCNIIKERNLYATDQYLKKINETNEFNAAEYAAQLCKYTISPYFDYLSKEANWILHNYSIQQNTIERRCNDTEKYLLQIYDKIKELIFQERGEYLRQKALDAERQKKLKNNLIPNMT